MAIFGGQQEQNKINPAIGPGQPAYGMAPNISSGLSGDTTYMGGYNPSAVPASGSIFAQYGGNSSALPSAAANQQFPGVTGSYGLYNTAVGQDAADRSNIMQGYKDLPNTAGYQNQANLAQTGGYSEQDKQDIRARDISPIRSIYSSAQQGLDRNKALQGGYSPNAAAASVKMARDASQQISDVTTNVNAGLAQNIAQNKIGMAPQYAAQGEKSLEGQASLYGTTPAMSKTFGDQALNAAQLQNQINQAPAINQPLNANGYRYGMPSNGVAATGGIFGGGISRG